MTFRLPSGVPRRTFLAVLLCATAPSALADAYSFPAALTSPPFNCTAAGGGSYNCPAISLSKDATITLTADVIMNVNGGFTAAKNFYTTNNGHTFSLVSSGSVKFQKDFNGTVDITASGSVSLAKATYIKGNITTSGSLTVAKDTTIDGSVVVSGDLSMAKNSIITGTCQVAGHSNYTCANSPPPPPPTSTLHHILIMHDGTAVTCTPAEVTVVACADAGSASSCTPYTGGASGNVKVTYSGGTLNVPFSIGAGVSSDVIDVPITTVETVTLGSTTTFSCWNGSSTSCSLSFADSGFLIDIPDHRSGSTQAFTIGAVRKADNAYACVPEFTTSKPINVKCNYTNPSTGSTSLALTQGGTSTSFACDGTNRSMTLLFDSDGEAALDLQYPDAGKVQFTASYGSHMTGSDSFIAAPNAFSVSVPAGPFKAGSAFNTTVKALATTGAVTPNFGKESAAEGATLAFTRCQPSADTPDNGIYTGQPGAFSAGIAITANSSRWTEVGNGDLMATLTSGNYLGSGMNVKGGASAVQSTCTSTDGALAFVPHHFKTELLTPPIAYTYSGQAMTVTVTAQNEAGAATKNYYKASAGSSFVKALTLGAWNGASANPGPGSWDSTAIALGSISNGAAGTGTVTFTPTYTLQTKLTAPVDVTVRVNDVDATSSGFTEAKTNVRNGRLRLSNAFGSVKGALAIPVTAQFWSGRSWIVNTQDDFTKVPASAVALTQNGVSGSTPTTISPLSAGQGELRLSRPAGTSGTIDIAVNLGATTTDTSCIGNKPPTVGAAQPWLRHTFGNCASPADPSARATFGVYPEETRRTIYIRESFN